MRKKKIKESCFFYKQNAILFRIFMPSLMFFKINYCNTKKEKELKDSFSLKNNIN